MSTLVTNRKSIKARKTAISYGAVTISCILFAKIYGLFGHGVTSSAMSLMFLFPLLGGLLPFLLLWLIGLPKMQDENADPARLANQYRFFYNSYNSGVATLTVGSLLSGILEIAGTASPYLIAFTIGGWLMLAIGFATLVIIRGSLVKTIS